MHLELLNVFVEKKVQSSFAMDKFQNHKHNAYLAHIRVMQIKFLAQLHKNM